MSVSVGTVYRIHGTCTEYGRIGLRSITVLWYPFQVSVFRCGHAAPPLQRRAISSSCAAVGARVRQKASTRSSRLLPVEHPAQSKRLRYGGGGLFREASFSLTECLSISVHPISTPPVSTPAWGVSQGEPGRFEIGISYSIQVRTNRRFRASVLTDFANIAFPERERESAGKGACAHALIVLGPPPLSDPPIHTRFRAIDVAARSTLIPSATIP